MYKRLPIGLHLNWATIFQVIETLLRLKSGVIILPF